MPVDSQYHGHLEEISIAIKSIFAALSRKVLSKKRTAQSIEFSSSSLLGTSISKESDILYSPYKSGEPLWVPVCMHIHTNRWEATYPLNSVVNHYKTIGAGVVIVTDHNRVTWDKKHQDYTLKAYEHGWGPHSSHVLAIGAENTITDRFPFGSVSVGKADTLSRLADEAPFLVLAHPDPDKSWSSKDVESLEYHALEIFNKSYNSTQPWDRALSAGNLVWCSAGDDCHDIRSRHQTGKRFLLVDLKESPPDQSGEFDKTAIIAALQNGAFVAVRHKSRELTTSLINHNLPMIVEFDWSGTSLSFKFDRIVDQVVVRGEEGRVVSTFEKSEQVRCSPMENEGYVRVELYHNNHIVALNPVVRLAK